MKVSYREVGAVVVAASIILFYILTSFLASLHEMNQASCTCGSECSMQELSTPTEYYVGLFGLSVLAFTGLALVVKGGDFGSARLDKGEWKKIKESLDDNEKNIVDQLLEADGVVFQSELVEKTGLSKVKVTRTLDKLESRRLLERRRRGMNNIIVLKGKGD